MNEKITSIEQLLVKPISWREEVPSGVEFYAYVDGDLCQLTMNDYPDNPLYTLRWHNDSLDIDDHPAAWSFEM